jgi:glucoamylase
MFNIGNRGGMQVPARDVVDGGFLELVRYGIRAADDPLIIDSVKALDASLKDDLPNGPSWRRYTYDGYGQHDDGRAFDGVGVGRPWPLLTSERAHYELAAGHDVGPYLQALEAFAGAHGLLPEQLWNADDIPSATPPLMKGGPTGSAMPLAWAHAEYIRLVRSVDDGKVFDQIPIVADWYSDKARPRKALEIWNFDRQITSIPRGTTLRIPLSTRFQLHWSSDGGPPSKETDATKTGVGIFYADIATDPATAGTLQFTFYWPDTQHSEGTQFSVHVA